MSAMSNIDANIRYELESLDGFIMREINTHDKVTVEATRLMAIRNTVCQWAKDQGMTGYPITNVWPS